MADRQWVSVTQHLPSNGVTVLVNDEREGVIAAVRNDAWVGGFCRFGRAVAHVTHWMPLPEPPAMTAERTTGAKVETPRTDAEIKRTAGIGAMSGMEQAWQDMCWFARQLERELIEVRSLYDELADAVQKDSAQHDGYVLVPKEPTEEMIQAAMPVAWIGQARYWKLHRLAAIEKYKAMLAALSDAKDAQK